MQSTITFNGSPLQRTANNNESILSKECRGIDKPYEFALIEQKWLRLKSTPYINIGASAFKFRSQSIKRQAALFETGSGIKLVWCTV